MNEMCIIFDCPCCGSWWTHPLINDDEDPKKALEEYKKYGGNIPPINKIPQSTFELLSHSIDMVKHQINVCGDCGNVYDSRIRAKLVNLNKWMRRRNRWFRFIKGAKKESD